MAQEAQKIIPDAVHKNGKGFLELNIDPIHWAMVNAVKELAATNEDLRSRLEKVEAQNSALRAYLCARDPGTIMCK